MTVLLLGVADEPPLALAAIALRRLGVQVYVWDQREVAATGCEVRVDDDGVHGELVCASGTVALDAVTGAYTRLAAWSALPALAGLAIDDPLVAHAAAVHAAVEGWLEATPARVVNRTHANDPNNAKPLQALAIRRHFHIPETLVTNRPEAALAFVARQPRTIYKSISGERSIVSAFEDDDRERLPLLRHAPIQLQAWIDGFDVRVHVVGKRVFATRVDSDAIDYRYDTGARFDTCELPPDVEKACTMLAAEMELPLAGIDLRFANDGRVYCFEVNPSPAYSVYESATNQPISLALAEFLTGQ